VVEAGLDAEVSCLKSTFDLMIDQDACALKLEVEEQRLAIFAPAKVAARIGLKKGIIAAQSLAPKLRRRVEGVRELQTEISGERILPVDDAIEILTSDADPIRGLCLRETPLLDLFFKDLPGWADCSGGHDATLNPMSYDMPLVFQNMFNQ
jgi:hypothetical protein